MYVDDDDDLNAPLESDNLPLRDEQGRFTSDEPPAEEPPAEEPPAEEPPAEEPPAEEPPAEEPPAEEPPAEEPPAEPEDKLKDQKVPYPRFKEAVTKERAKREAAERELTELRERLSQIPDVDVTEDELNAIGDMLLEGKTADYAKGMKGILAKVFEKGVQAATERARDVTRIESAEDREMRERQEAAARWQAEYPEFDPNSAQFNEDLLDEALALRDAYEARGMSPSAAIERAVKRIAGDKTPPAPPPPTPPARKSTVQAKMAVADSQPPIAAGMGDHDKPTTLLSRVAQMTDEEFDQLSEADLERLRRGEKL